MKRQRSGTDTAIKFQQNKRKEEHLELFPADGHQVILNKINKKVEDKQKADEYWQNKQQKRCFLMGQLTRVFLSFKTPNTVVVKEFISNDSLLGTFIGRNQNFDYLTEWLEYQVSLVFKSTLALRSVSLQHRTVHNIPFKHDHVSLTYILCSSDFMLTYAC